MSYTVRDAEIEYQSQVDEVLQTRDIEGALGIACSLYEMGDDEQGHYFRKLARRWEREDNYHDEVTGN